MDVYARLQELGIQLHHNYACQGVYAPVKEFGERLAYLSGIGPNSKDLPVYLGKVGAEFTLEQAQQAARQVIVNTLSMLNDRLGDLNRILRIVKVLGFVASADNFVMQPAVVNAASQMLVDIFGEENGLAARSAIGVNVLPGNIPVEIEMLIELKDEFDL